MTEAPNYPDGPDFLYTEAVRTMGDRDSGRTAELDRQPEVTPRTRTRGAANL
jgi:hypothetical protein